MQRKNHSSISTSSIFSAAAAATVMFGFAGIGSARPIVFDNIPAPLPGNVVSLGYQATSTAEAGNAITLAGTDRDLTNVRILMSDWASHAEWPAVGDATGYDHPITVNLYNAGAGDTVGSLIATRTQNVHVPWHTPGDGFNGIAFNVDFDFTGVTAPNSLIFGVAYNTQSYGASPIGAGGPYNSLNYGFGDATPSVGTDIDSDNIFVSSTWAGLYTDGGAGGLGTFREDTGWTDYVPGIQITAIPEPSMIGLVGLAACGLLARRGRRNSTVNG